MSSYKNCGNCANVKDCLPDWCGKDLFMWDKISCPHCGGILSEIREHNGKQYRHCYGCHFEFAEGGE